MEKVKICKFDLEKRREDPAEALLADYNPESYTVSTESGYQVTADDLTASRSLAYVFLGKKPSVLTMELLFDSYIHGAAAAQTKDVRTHFTLLRNCLLVNPEKHTPPGVQISWAQLVFVGVLTSMKETYTMFLETGKPVRAKVEITVTGCRKEELTATPNQSPDRTKRRVVMQGETLWALAAREYGSPQQWRPIAQANGLDNPRKLAAAQELVIPVLPGGGT